MKKLINKISVALFAVAGALSGCMKDANYNNGTYQTLRNATDATAVEIKLSAQDFSNFQYQALKFAAADSIYNLAPIQFDAKDPASEDINVTVQIDNGVLAAYNAANGTSLRTPGTDTFSVVSNTVTIPKGATMAYYKAKVNVNKIITGKWGIGLKITAVSKSGCVISGNSGTGVVQMGPANQWYGSYAVTGYFFHPSSPRAISATYSMQTVSLVTNKIPVGDLGSSNYYAQFDVSGSTLTNFHAAGATPSNAGFLYTDNPSNTNYSAALPDYPGVTYKASKYNNTYDAANKTFWMYYQYNGTRQIYEKWVQQ